jgi:hypothetical protein
MSIDDRSGPFGVGLALVAVFWSGAASAALTDEAQPADDPQTPEVSGEPEAQPSPAPAPPADAELEVQAPATAGKPVASAERERREPVPAAPPESGEPFTQFRIVSEAGFLVAASHTIQFSKDGTKFDYVDEGGQDNAFLVTRHSAELELDARHTIIALYQPLDLRTSVRLDRDVSIDGAVFREGTAVDLRYGFDFYRLSYLFDLFGERPRDELSLGLSLQMRNAAIEFTAADGSLRRAARDVGPVPLLKLRGRWGVSERTWLGIEVDGIWAPIKYINGSDSDVEGALVDLSLRVGYRVVRSLDAFFNLRYLAGGAEGTSSDDSGPGDGYNDNWLHFLTFTLGLEWSPTDLGR